MIVWSPDAIRGIVSPDSVVLQLGYGTTYSKRTPVSVGAALRGLMSVQHLLLSQPGNVLICVTQDTA